MADHVYYYVCFVVQVSMCFFLILCLFRFLFPAVLLVSEVMACLFGWMFVVRCADHSESIGDATSIKFLPLHMLSSE